MKIKLYYQGNLDNEKSWKRREYYYSNKIIEECQYTLASMDNSDYDILHLNTIGIKSYKALKKAKLNNKKVIFQVHDDIYSHMKWGILTGFIYGFIVYRQQKYAKKSDVVIVNKASTKLLFDERKLKNKNVVLVKRGLRDNNFNIPDLSKLAFKRYFQITDKDKVICGAGNVCWQKGYYDFIKVARQFPELKFIWFCQKPTILDVENRNFDKNLPNNVIISHFINQECYLGAFGSADVFLLPYYEEESSNTILKAMAGGRTIIVRNAPLNTEFVHGEHYYKGNSIDDFAWLIENIINHKLPNTGKKAKEAVYDAYCLKTNSKIYKGIYEKLLNK